MTLKKLDNFSYLTAQRENVWRRECKSLRIREGWLHQYTCDKISRARFSTLCPLLRTRKRVRACRFMYV